MSFRSCCSLALGLALAASAHATDFSLWVGDDGRNCDHATIQAAIDAASPAAGDTTTINISGGSTYAEDLTIDGKNVRLIGSSSSCGPFFDPLPRPVISGAGGARRSIVNLRGATRIVEMRNLFLRDGDELTDTDSYGGAVDITQGPHALVYFEGTSWVANSAGWGGALSIRNGSVSRPQDIVVRFGPNNLITTSRAHYGGGAIHCRDATLDITGSNNLITGNYAGDNLGLGGGMYLDDCLVKLAGDNDAGVVNNNAAKGNGGGIYITNEFARLDIFNIDPDHPTRIRNNVAGGNGGGINAESGSEVYAWDVLIEGNRARAAGGGVAIYNYDEQAAGGSSGGRTVFLATSQLFDSSFGPPQLAPAGALLCRVREQCNAILDNLAADANDSPRDGAAIRVSSDTGVLESYGYAVAGLHSTRLAGNSGRNLIFVRSWNDDALAWTDLYGSVVSGNVVADNLIDVSGDDGYVEFSQSTITGNTIGGAGVLRFEDAPGAFDQSEDNRFFGNIVWQPGKLFFVNTPREVVARFNLVNEQSLVPPGERAFNLVGYPLFQAPAYDDYRLLTGSPALDLAQFSVPFTRDGGPRSIDLPSVPNVAGPVDAGAYELARTNATPLAYRMGIETARNTPVDFVLTGSDPDGDPIALYVVEPPLHGTVTGTPPNLTYTPANGYIGPDVLLFVANDGAADSLPAPVDILVSVQPNRPPIAQDQSVSTPQGSPLGITLTAIDPDGDPVTIGVESSPAHGTLSGSGANLVYLPAAGYVGPDAFTFSALDATSSSAPATVTIAVTPATSIGAIFSDGFE